MESLIALLGLLFFMFLVLSAAVETILEVFRGLLERVGLTWAKGKVSLDDALKLAAEFAPDEKDLNTKLQAVKSAAEQIQDKVPNQLTTLETLKQQLVAAGGGAAMNVIAAEINGVAATVKKELEKSESRRVWLLRFIAAVIGCLLAWQAQFYVFQILANSPNAKEWLGTLQGLQAVWINILVGGLAAAAGSSYWHDQLDKIRNLKSASEQVKKITK